MEILFRPISFSSIDATGELRPRQLLSGFDSQFEADCSGDGDQRGQAGIAVNRQSPI